MSERSSGEYSEPSMTREDSIPCSAEPDQQPGTDLATAKRLLPLVSRTFAINIRVLNRPMRHPVRLAYLLCRACDALEDSWPGPAEEVDNRFERLLLALEGDPAALRSLSEAAASIAGSRNDLRVLAELPTWLRSLETTPAPVAEAVRVGVRAMAEGMRRYAVREASRPPETSYLDDEAELKDYCYVVAGCVGEMLTRIHAHTSRLSEDADFEARMRLSVKVGEALQLTNILLDWPSDVPKGRCHIPTQWLSGHGISPGGLASADRMVARELALRLAGHAHAALDQVADYLDLVPLGHVRYRLFVLWPALWARASLHAAIRDRNFPTCEDRPRLSRAQLWGSAAGSLLVSASHAGVRRLLEAPAR